MKNKKIKPSSLAVAALISSAVLVSFTHAKDIVKAAPASDLSAVNAKALGDLHNHTDKTVLKVFAKAVSDSGVAARERELKADMIKVERNLTNQLLEFLLFWRFALTVRL